VRTSAPPTKPGTRKLSDVARHLVVPEGVASSGWPAVREKCLDLGVRFDDWQDGLGRAILAKRADGKYAAGVGGVVISIPRQVGKTYTVGAIVFALCVLYPGLTVVWTAHRSRTAGETFRSMQGMARRRKIAPFVDQVFTGSGDEEVRFRNGSRILFGARERGFGRGFAEVDVEVFDEAQILTEKALDDMVPATNQSKQPAGALLFFIGTPPKDSDPGEAFTAKRAKALAGRTSDTLFVEMSADPEADPDDRRQWAKANPSYPRHTSPEAMLRMRENLSDESFLREALGIWTEKTVGGAFDDELWAVLADPDAAQGDHPAFGVAVAPDRSWSAVAVAWQRPDAATQVQVVRYDRGTSWIPDRVAELVDRWSGSVLTTDDAPELPEAKRLNAADLRRAEATFDDALTARTVRHFAQPELDVAVGAARWRKQGDGRVLQRSGRAEISPVVAAALALHGLRSQPPPRRRALVSF
jgi:hypothetical protein